MKIMNMQNSKMSELHKFIFHLTQRLDLKSPDKYVDLHLLHIGNIRQQYKNSNLKIIAPMLNDAFEIT